MIGANELPEVITEPGDYVTRDGRRVTIREIKPGSYFVAKGSIWSLYRGKVRPRGYHIWHKSGRSFPLAECAADIVGPWLEGGDQ